MTFETLPKVRSARAQVEDVIARLIKTMHPGDQLPSEPELASQLGVSRATLREVLRSFADRGLLVRRQGVGTFVTSRIPILETGLEVLESLERMADRLDLHTEVAFLTIDERHATAVERHGLDRVEPVEVLAVTRVITVEGEPVADLLDVVPLTFLRAADLGESFKGSVLDVLLARSKPVVATSRTEIAAASAPDGLARRLGIAQRTALLKLVAQLYSYDEQIVDYSVSYFVPGYFKFHVMRQVR
ncbi:MAG: GntR family transcriptional regulator [Anaerolineae bacterium]|nr:GntR family transcriptional regulator [Anaerolineae bacterium]